LIDIPNAYTPPAVFTVGGNLTFPIGEDTLNPLEANSYVEIKVPYLPSIGISFFTQKIVVLNFKYQIHKETNKVPAIAIGSEYFTPYHEWVSPVGAGEGVGWSDDLREAHRNPEQFSFFVVVSKNQGPYGTYTIGLGRGAFVGYGHATSGFNSDAFTKKYNKDAIGIFWGVEFAILPPVCGVIDFDGRDYNMGIKISLPYFQIGIGFAKVEHRFFKKLEGLFPRVALGVTTNYLVIKRALKRPTGTLLAVVRDARRGETKRAIITFPGTTLPPIITEGATGRCSIELEPGIYWVRAGSPGYFWADRTVNIVPNQTTLCHFEIRAIEGP
jgi:hypothetical protein